MQHNNPLIKSRGKDRIISKTADIFELFINENEERRMATTPKSLKATVISGVETELNPKIAKNAGALRDAVNSQATSLYTRVHNIFARTSASTPTTVFGPATLFGKPNQKPDVEPRNTPKFGR